MTQAGSAERGAFSIPVATSAATEAIPVGDGQWAVPGNRWDLVPKRPADRSVPEITVVIPYFENQPGLDQVLTALALQTHPVSRLQVVIADDGSRQAPTIPHSAAALTTTVVRQADQGFRAAAARNLGARVAEGSVLAFLDGDTVPTPSYLENLCRLPDLLPEAVVGGRRRYGRLAGWDADRIAGWLAGDRPAPDEIPEPAWLVDAYRRTGDLLRCGPRGYTYLIGAVLGCSRDFFSEMGGFDESISGYGGEDYETTYRMYNLGAVLRYVPTAVAWHDGPDWAGRTPTSDQVAQKNRETMMLAARIPEPSLRGTGQVYLQCDVIVRADVTGWPLGAAVLCLRSLLQALDCGIWLDGAVDDIAALASCFEQDPRVRSGAVDPLVASRARAVLNLAAPTSIDSRFRTLLDAMMTDDVGRIELVRPGGTDAGAVTDTLPPVTVASTRSLRRTARWASHAPDAAWFDEQVLAADAVGVATTIAGEPALAAVFGGWG